MRIVTEYGQSTPLTIKKGPLNDMWKFQVNDSSWTWISGSDHQRGAYGEKGNASSENIPGARYGAVGCYDSLSKEFWLFGGSGYDTTDRG